MALTYYFVFNKASYDAVKLSAGQEGVICGEILSDGC